MTAFGRWFLSVAFVFCGGFTIGHLTAAVGVEGVEAGVAAFLFLAIMVYTIAEPTGIGGGE